MMYVTFDTNWEHYGTALGNTIFNNLNMEKWIMSPFGRTIIEDVGNSEIIGPNAFRLKNTNYVYGSHDLSGGIKNLFLIYRGYDVKKPYYLGLFGENCRHHLAALSRVRDFDIICRGFDMHFRDEKLLCIARNDGRKILNGNDWADALYDLLLGGDCDYR